LSTNFVSDTLKKTSKGDSMKIERISKPTHGSKEWLALRWKNENGEARISASIAAAVHGTHPYTKTADLVAELIAAEPPKPKPQNSAMLRGTTLEEPIRNWSANLLGYPLHEPQEMYSYEEDGVRLIATIDAINPDGLVHEIKTSKKRFDNKLPEMWYWQGVQQAICTGTDEVVWCVFDSDMDLKFHTQKVTSDEKRTHIDACRRLLSYVDMGMFPDDVRPTYQNVSTVHPKADDKAVELDTDTMSILEQLRKAQEVSKSMEEHISQLQAEVCRVMGDASTATHKGIVQCTWKNVNRKSFDQKKFEEEHPALRDKYKKQTTYRQFKSNKGEY
jgi:predicted phage-related endonuclease